MKHKQTERSSDRIIKDIIIFISSTLIFGHKKKHVKGEFKIPKVCSYIPK